MDDNKKPGQRDISDLKARLGLKKTAAMPAVAPNTTPAQGQAVPAPAPNVGSGPTAAPQVPSPFGQPAQPSHAAPPSPWGQPAQPAPQPPPDPRRDPFAQQQAANLAAFYGINQQLPGSSDSAPIPVGKPRPWGPIIGLGGAAFIAFLLGMFWGGTQKSRVEYNESTEHAKAIRDQVTAMQKTLEGIVLELRKNTVNGKIDLGQADRLAGALPSKRPDDNLLFRTDYSNLEGLGIQRLFTYYNDTIKLYEAIEQHARKTGADRDTLQKIIDAAARTADKNYGFVVDASSQIPLALFVEVGAPLCPKEGQVDCSPAELKGFQYRLEAGQAWSSKPIKGKPAEVIYPLKKSPLFTSVAVGSITPLEDYNRRFKNIVTIAADLEKTQKELLPDIKKTAERPTLFTF